MVNGEPITITYDPHLGDASKLEQKRAFAAAAMVEQKAINS